MRKRSRYLKQVQKIYRKFCDKIISIKNIIEKSFHCHFTFRIKRKFLTTVIQSIQRSKIPDDPGNLLKVKACIYIDALITFFKQVNNVRQNKVVNLQPLSEITTKLNVHIKKKFAQPHINQT